jgi:hypothetical protein
MRSQARMNNPPSANSATTATMKMMSSMNGLREG